MCHVDEMNVNKPKIAGYCFVYSFAFENRCCGLKLSFRIKIENTR